jgi:hypothetical protein
VVSFNDDGIRGVFVVRISRKNRPKWRRNLFADRKTIWKFGFLFRKKHVPICEGTAEKVEFTSRVHIFSPPYPNPTNKMFSALLVIIPY